MNQVRSKVACCVLLATPGPRGVFLKTVFSTFVEFDSAPVEGMRGSCHLFVKRNVRLVKNGRRAKPLISQCLCFSPQSDRLVLSDRSETRRRQFFFLIEVPAQSFAKFQPSSPGSRLDRGHTQFQRFCRLLQ